MRAKNKFIGTIFQLQMEKEIRCGSGNGKPITSHSVNCKCEQLDRDIVRVKQQG